LLRTSVAFKADPTSATFNAVLTGILPLGIYQGGRCLPGPALSVRVEPFFARSRNLTVWDEEWDTVVIASTGIHYICLEAKHLPHSPSVPDWLILTPAELALRPDSHELLIFCVVNIPTGETITKPEYIDHAQATRLSLDGADFFGRLLSGTINLNGTTGVMVTHNLGHTDYVVMVTPSETPNTGLGDIYVEKAPTTFTIFITGLATTEIDWMLINKRPVPGEEGLAGVMISPVGLNGPAGFTYPHNLNSIDHQTVIVPEGHEPELAGITWVELGSTSDVIRNTGSPVRAIAGFIPTVGAPSLGSAQSTFVPVEPSQTAGAGTGDVVMGAYRFTGSTPVTYQIEVKNKAGSAFDLDFGPLPGAPTGMVHIDASNQTNIHLENGLVLTFADLANFQNGDTWQIPIQGQSIAHGLGHLDYFVHVVPITDDPIDMNSFWVKKQANAFEVWQNGSHSGAFQFLLVTDIDQFIHGNGVISGPVDNVVNHYLNNPHYVPLITPADDVGQFSIYRAHNLFEVYASRPDNIAFEWLVMPQRVIN